MYDEKVKRANESDSLILACGDSEKREGKVTGEIFDYAIYPDGRRELLNHDHNTIVDGCSKLIASLFKAQSGYSGLTYWAVGSGLDTWDNANPPSPELQTPSL
jgi:hypothetical protein